MEADDRTQKLLEEIRDVQREQLAEYRRVTQQSLDLQQRAVARQEQASLFYKRLVLFGGDGYVTQSKIVGSRLAPYRNCCTRIIIGVMLMNSLLFQSKMMKHYEESMRS